jgi:hypothetical protein
VTDFCVVLVAVVLVTVGTLAVMNKACKSSPTSVVRSDVQLTAPHKNWLTSSWRRDMCGDGAPSRAASSFILRHPYRGYVPEFGFATQ